MRVGAELMESAMTIHSIRIGKLNHDVAINDEKMPMQSKDFVFNYGLKQLLNDSFVSGETDEERHNLLERKVEKLYAGTLSIRDGGTRESDPLAREITKLATGKTSEHFKKKGVKAAAIDPAQWKVVIGKFRAHPALIELAKANVEAANAVEIEIE